MTSQNLKPLIELQLNTTHFFNQFYQKHQAHMQCKMGCAQCCHVDLSIFEGEATAILEWVRNLEDEKKQALLLLLKSPEQTSTYKKRNPCAFLRNNQCSIYEARPIICRTQGIVLQYKTQTDRNSTQIHADVCPLNFTKEENFPEQKEWLDLDRLNSLQSIAENFFQKMDVEKETLPKNKEGRVELRKLKEEIMTRLNKNY